VALKHPLLTIIFKIRG